MRESKLRWFEHIHKWLIDALVRACEKIEIDNDRVGKGQARVRPK